MNFLTLFIILTFSISYLPDYQSYHETMVLDDLKRKYIVYASNQNIEKKLPVIIVLHGGGGTAGQIQKSAFRLERKARQNGAVLIYPDAINNSWNVAGMPTYRQKESDADDVRFIDSIIDKAIEEWNGDPDRIFVTGPSRGGQMSFYLGQVLNHRISGIAPMIASIHREMFDSFQFDTPVPTLVINGTEDPLIPYGGGAGQFGKRRFRGYGKGVVPTEELMKKIASMNGCDDTFKEQIMPDIQKRDSSYPVRYKYQSCPVNTPVILIKVVGGGHTLPGGGQYAPKWFIGSVNRDFHAFEEVWEFFIGLGE